MVHLSRLIIQDNINDSPRGLVCLSAYFLHLEAERHFGDTTASSYSEVQRR